MALRLWKKCKSIVIHKDVVGPAVWSVEVPQFQFSDIYAAGQAVHCLPPYTILPKVAANYPCSKIRLAGESAVGGSRPMKNFELSGNCSLK